MTTNNTIKPRNSWIPLPYTYVWRN